MGGERAKAKSQQQQQYYPQYVQPAPAPAPTPDPTITSRGGYFGAAGSTIGALMDIGNTNRGTFLGY